MSLPELSVIEKRSQEIVEAMEGENEDLRESVDVYEFLCKEFARGSVRENYVFQFTYRSFYTLDNAGLTSQFKRKYFSLMEDSRGFSDIDLPGLARELHAIQNIKHQHTLQFSFVTKLAHTVSPVYPIYDSLVARVFGFRVPSNDKGFADRLNAYMNSYGRLRSAYAEIINRNLLAVPRQLFRDKYSASIPETKALDFIFWSAGKQEIKTHRHN